MHAWQEKFPRAARVLSDREVTVLNTPHERPKWTKAENSTSFVTSSDPQVLDFFGVAPAAAGFAVTPETAMRVSTVYACVRLIAGAIATLPLPVYQLGEKNVREAVTDHPLKLLLNEQPTPRFSAALFWEFLVSSILLRGDGFAIIVRDRAGNITELIPIRSEYVIVERRGNRLAYFIEDDGKRLGFDQSDVLHFAGFGFNGWRSMSVIRFAAFQAIGSALAMEAYAGKFFVNGAGSKIVLSTPNELDQDQLQELRDLWGKVYAGPDNSGKPLILHGGLTATPLSMTMQDAQLLESRKYQAEDIARAFGVPPFMVGIMEKTTSFGSGVEHMSMSFLIYVLMPYLTRISQEINRKCFLINKYFVEFNTNGLLQADAKGRSQFLREALGGARGPGWMTVNEVRKVENLPPIDGGDQLFVPANVNTAAEEAADTDPNAEGDTGTANADQTNS